MRVVKPIQVMVKMYRGYMLLLVKQSYSDTLTLPHMSTLLLEPMYRHAYLDAMWVRAGPFGRL